MHLVTCVFGLLTEQVWNEVYVNNKWIRADTTSNPTALETLKITMKVQQ